MTNPETQSCVLDDAYILIFEKKNQLYQRNWSPYFQAVAESGKAFLIIAEDVEGEALATLVVNRLRAGLKVCAVKAPGFGDRRKGHARRYRYPYGGQVISEELGQKLEATTIEMLGRAKKDHHRQGKHNYRRGQRQQNCY